MRILKYMFNSAIILVLLSFVAFLIGREILLSMATSQIRNAIASLREARNAGGYVSECLNKGSIFIEGEELVRYQLRFTSPSSYILEVICDQFSFDPIELSSDDLPPFITKKEGSSGITLDENAGGVKLETFSELTSTLNTLIKKETSFLVRESGVYILDDRTYYTEEDTVIAPGPQTTCSGYGYTCCSTISQIGEGDQFIGSSDCDKTCYSQCVARPVLLSFETNPFINLSSRMLEIQPETLVDFAYVASHEAKQDLLAVITFGDGQSVTLNGNANQVSHTYTCASQQCRYTASITITDTSGVVSVASEVSRIPVLVAR